ncbi:SDR family NAD(P)-dependent oxidoreductase [Nocardiopsis sp. NPDC006198]|uniref:SDR family NAD(P)-dependent oxidoreductase n=1 Tax=Nocardiopsis sp. NPDC006198 TaxID=3154472 RepID=UPI0033A443EE
MPEPGRRVAVVTGAGRGIGLEICRQLARLDHTVVLTARSAAAAERSAADLGPHVHPLQLDVTSATAAGAVVDEVVGRLGRLDVWVNNAAVVDDGTRPSTVPMDTVAAVLDTNLVGAWRCAQAALPHMRRAGYGRIVNVTSTLGALAAITDATDPAYRVSKAALHALTRVLAFEAAGTGVLVNAASPGWARTTMGGPDAPRAVEAAADTPVWLATLPPNGPTGGLFHDRQPFPW